MERTLTMEEKIRRAEEIYSRRNNISNIYNTKENKKSQKDWKLFKKVTCQIIVCLLIYFFYYAVNNNYIFSEDLIQKTQETLSYDMNFIEVYNNCKNYINGLYNNQETNDSELKYNITTDDKIQNEKNEEENKENNEQSELKEKQTSSEENNVTQEESIGGAKIESIEESVDIGQKQNKESDIEQSKEMSQEERDIIEIKNNISFIKPIEGTISSTFGWRNPTTATVPKYHTGLDIAAPTGTVIKSATDGTVLLASSQGDYRKSFKDNKWRTNNYLCAL